MKRGSTMTKFIQTNAFTLKKTVSYYFSHITVTVIVAYAVTGDWFISITLSLLEPSVQTVVYFFHERLWSRTKNKKSPQLVRVVQ
jgi:uncharacterized membrane protein